LESVAGNGRRVGKEDAVAENVEESGSGLQRVGISKKKGYYCKIQNYSNLSD
jgi:hypothetical protein